jgi:protein-S-isoprenylcysteine O-methyltransferase Ste14
MVINAAIIVLGFWAPWIEPWGIGSRVSLLEWLALELSRTGLLPFTQATPVVILAGAIVAGIGALLRVWGTAYLGAGTVQGAQMKADGVMADGPYRFVRNPLYLGLWCMVAAMALLMPPTGALFSLALLTAFVLRLILGEEAFLSSQLGDTYRAYVASVVFFTLAALSWTYDNRLMGRAILISLGISLVVRAVLPQTKSDLGTPASS